MEDIMELDPKSPSTASDTTLRGDPTPSVAGVLSSFDQLRDADKTAVAQFIARGMKCLPLESADAPSSSPTPTELAHSCGHCQNLIVYHSEWTRAEEDSYFHNSYMRCSKDDILNGFANQCILFVWVLEILDRALHRLRLDISKTYLENSLSLSNHSRTFRGGETDNLEYVSFETGLLIWFRTPHSNLALLPQERGAEFCISYEIDPHLIDQLWECRAKLEMTIDYPAFVDYYGKAMTRKGPFRMSTSSDDLAAAYIPSRPTDLDVSSDASVRMMRNWLTDCHEKHSKCPKSRGIMPARIIDIGTKRPLSFVRLHWTEEGETGNFAALSYCWGGEPPIRSTVATAQDFTDGIRFSKFPKTLQDAMTVASKLNIRFIWIDCICIIQDDPEDVSREIAKMPQIFQEAYVTISASSAKSVNEGFLQPRRSEPGARIKLPYKIPNRGLGSVLLEEPRQYTPAKDPISLRAWTLQEHILSPRILDFGCKDLWWVCQTVKRCEDGEPMTKNIQIEIPFSLGSWRSTLHDYTRRFLTFSGDKLPAISGVAAEYGNIFQSEYLAGLWQFALPSDLLWSAARSDISRPTVQRAPSWSWAAVDGEISHKWIPTSFRDPATVLDCRATPVSLSAPYGAINPTLSAYLKVQGFMKQFRWDKTKQNLYESTNDEETNTAIYVGRTHADADEKLPRDEESWISVWALVIVQGPTRGLMLVPVREGYFRRVGLFYRLWGEGLEGFETSTITII